MKKEIDRINATPSKRLFLSIIADYDLNRSICELVDNGIDVWIKAGKLKPIEISVQLDERQQAITVTDNAGGLARADLRYIVGPGHSGTTVTDMTIGIFGVGTKRAVVALAQDIKIKTRHGKAKTYEVDFDDTWLEDEDWELPVYEVDDIGAGTTVVELSRLRLQLSTESIAHLQEHLGATYARFLQGRAVTIRVNVQALKPQFFEDWAYPPKYGPRKYYGKLKTEDHRDVTVEVIAGLSRESSPAAGEYGVYFYCNDRLIVRAQKSFEVGFTRGLAGLPHPKVSLTRVLVCLKGDARAMPWNSSKSDINTKHEVFLALHGWLVQVVKSYASLSRIWMGDWPDKVFKYDSGEIEEVEVTDFPTAKKSFLPPLPKSRPRFADVTAHDNRAVARRKPWTRGLYEGVIAADLISKQRMEERNRIALVVLDSTLEIAFKEYLVNESGVAYGDIQLLNLFKNRSAVHAEIKKYVSFNANRWKKIEHYYRLRCKLVHERATVGISDQQIADFRDLVECVLRKLYKLKFRPD